MAKFSLRSARRPSASAAARGLGLLGSAALASTLLCACAGDTAVEFENQKAAQEVARLAGPPGSLYRGWRLFQEKCASCHGPNATGTGSAPDLLPRVREMGPRRFTGLVLQRYDWNLSPAESHNEGQALDRLIDDILQRKGPVVIMPAWQGSPAVSAHILDLYSWLAARAEGSQGEGRPLP